MLARIYMYVRAGTGIIIIIIGDGSLCTSRIIPVIFSNADNSSDIILSACKIEIPASCRRYRWRHFVLLVLHAGDVRA